MAAGQEPLQVTPQERGQFLLDYIELLVNERVDEADGFRHTAPGQISDRTPATGRAKWVINKLRALNAWYTKGLSGGSHLRTQINSAESLAQLRELIVNCFVVNPKTVNIENHSPLAVLPE